MQALAQTIIDSFAGLQPCEEWSFRDARRTETNCFTHGYHRYPAKFIPQIVRKLLFTYTSEGDWVGDPFGGCGTTLVEAKLMGRRSIGFDINPVANLIAQAKVTAINPEVLEESKEQYLSNYAAALVVPLEHHPRLHYWFDDRILEELDRIYRAIKEIKLIPVRRFFLCAFSHNLKTCSKWLMKSIKPTIDQDKTIIAPSKTFLRQIDFMIGKNRVFYDHLLNTGNINTVAKMYRRDSTRRLPVQTASVDLVISSPPYVTSYEYADLHQLSLLWFGEDLTHFRGWSRLTCNFDSFRKTFMGTSRRQGSSSNLGSTIAGRIVDELSSVDKSTAVAAANYFMDMRKAFGEMYRMLKPGAKACIIVGNTNLCGVRILNAEVAAEQMSSIGLNKVDFIKREVPNKMITPWRDIQSGKFTGLSNPNKTRAYECEFIIVMQKPSN